MSAASLRPVYYSSSGMVPPLGWILVICVLLPLAAAAGVAYCAALVFLPLGKLVWLATVALGWILGAASTAVGRWGRARSKTFVVMSAVAAVLVAYYFAWGAHRPLVAARQIGADPQLFLISFLPTEIFDWAGQMFQRGWVAGLAGWPLVLVWLFEFGLIAGVARSTFQSRWDDRPYCEQCECWTSDPQPLVNLPVSPNDPAWELVKETGPDSLRKLNLKEDASELVSLSVTACPQCDRSNYLSASGGGWGTDSEGQPVFHEIPIFRYMSVTPQQIESIRELGELLEEAYRELSEERALEGEPEAVPE